jgi:hypothetical protein
MTQTAEALSLSLVTREIAVVPKVTDNDPPVLFAQLVQHGQGSRHPLQIDVVAAKNPRPRGRGGKINSRRLPHQPAGRGVGIEAGRRQFSACSAAPAPTLTFHVKRRLPYQPKTPPDAHQTFSGRINPKDQAVLRS